MSEPNIVLEFKSSDITVTNYAVQEGSNEGFTIHGSKRRRKSIYFTNCTITGGFDYFLLTGQPKKRKALIHKGGKP